MEFWEILTYGVQIMVFILYLHSSSSSSSSEFFIRPAQIKQ